jgi:hypothetical protein
MQFSVEWVPNNCGGQSDTVTGFSPSRYHATIAPYLILIVGVIAERQTGEAYRPSNKSDAFSESWEQAFIPIVLGIFKIFVRIVGIRN